jgi:plasmid stability protein
MAQILVRDLDDDTVATLKQRAKEHHRSLQGEVKSIIEETCKRKSGLAQVRKDLEVFHANFCGRVFSSSADLVREDRER